MVIYRELRLSRESHRRHSFSKRGGHPIKVKLCASHTAVALLEAAIHIFYVPPSSSGAEST